MILHLDRQNHVLNLLPTSGPILLNKSSLRALTSIFRDLHARPIGPLFIYSGADHFCFGANIHELVRLNPQTAREFGQLGQSLMNLIESYPPGVSCVVDGYCFGGGFDLALACRQVYVGPKALFCHPGIYRGITTGFGGTIRLPQKIGVDRAQFTFATGFRINAQTAVEWGLAKSISAAQLP